MIHSLCLKNASLSFISKKENFNIPIGRHYINRMCYLPLDRGNIKSGIETINRAIYFLNNDITSIGLFPEGTRSETLELLPFHDGCFKIATKTHCPIVVGVTQGTEKIHKNWPFKRTKVTFDVVKVIYGEEYKDKKSVELSDMIRNLILEKLNENNQSEKIGE